MSHSSHTYAGSPAGSLGAYFAGYQSSPIPKATVFICPAGTFVTAWQLAALELDDDDMSIFLGSMQALCGQSQEPGPVVHYSYGDSDAGCLSSYMPNSEMLTPRTITSSAGFGYFYAA